ncbi:hypothetical protein ES703_37369 [subsurface metagenome]
MGGGDIFHRLFWVFGIDHLPLFTAHPFSHNGAFSFFQGRLKHIVVIRVYRALDHVLPQPPGGGDKDCIGKPGFCIDREDHPGRCLIGSDHLLDTNREIHIKLAKALIVAVGDGPVGKKRGKATLTGIDEGIFSPDIQKGLLLSGKGGIREVFCSGRGAHCHISPFSIAALHGVVASDNGLGEIRGEVGVSDDLPHRITALLQITHIVGV